MKCTMQLERTTKGAIRYEEIEGNHVKTIQDGAIIGKLYIRKTAFAGKPAPAVIQVTITSE